MSAKGKVMIVDNSTFNLVAALERVDGDTELLAEIMEMFLEDAPPMLQDIQDALDAQDAETCASVSHTLKGCAGNFSADRVHELAARVNAAASDGDIASARPIMPVLRDEYAKLESALKQFIEENPLS